jgi:arsenite-transporting ATPase
VVRVDGQKRTILLPPALAPYSPSGASFSEGSLLVSFSG